MMKKGDFKQSLNFSPKEDHKSQFSPEKQSAGANLLVLKKYKFESQVKSKEELRNSPPLSKSISNPFSSNIISNNLLLSLKNKKLSQTTNPKEKEETKRMLSLM